MGNSIAAASWVPGRAALASQQADRTADQTRVARAAAAAPRGHPSIATQQTPRYTCGPSNLRARRTMNLLKWIDLPPVWLIGTLGAAFGLDRMLPGLGLGFDPLGWLGQALVAAGRTAFSNYIGTSLVMQAVFMAWGLGLFGRYGDAALWPFVVAAWAAMLLWSPLWLKRYRRGPLEWAWRSLVEKQILPNRR